MCLCNNIEREQILSVDNNYVVCVELQLRVRRLLKQE